MIYVINELIDLKDEGVSIEELDKKERSDFHASLDRLNTELEIHINSHLEELNQVNVVVEQTQASNLRMVIIMVVSAIVLTTMIGFYIYHLISLSISRTMNAAVEIAKGNLDVDIDTSGRGEIGELSRAIAKMRDSLKVVLNEYEKKMK